MVEKNQKKFENKRRRNFWSINPITRFKGNDKGYDRKRFKKEHIEI